MFAVAKAISTHMYPRRKDVLKAAVHRTYGRFAWSHDLI
jgi:hypothetical protein